MILWLKRDFSERKTYYILVEVDHLLVIRQEKVIQHIFIYEKEDDVRRSVT